jgi:3-oxoacyl-[acyl-carrier-protein] synthase-3
MSEFGKITAAAHYVPARTVTNDELSEILETNDEWITSRTGIRKRRIATTENTSELCTEVANLLLKKRHIEASEIDFIIVATMTPDFATPSTACLVQGNIGAVNALAFDLSAACSGFAYALSVAEKFMRTGSKKGLVIGGEVLSKVIDWSDRSTAVLFGDAAGGVLLEQATTQHLLAEKLQADGTRGLSLTAGETTPANPFMGEEAFASTYLKMDGRAIFDFAIGDVPKNILAMLSTANTQPSEVDYYLLHQANLRIIDKMARKLKVDRAKFLTNMDLYGNTSAATIPVLLSESIENGTIAIGSNKKLVLAGFGGGLTWGSLLITI